MTDYARFRAGFAAALDPDFYPLSYLDELVATSRGLLWTTNRAAIVAEIKTYPGGAKVIHGLVATGDLREIVETLIPKAEAWGREQGCRYAIIESREGWARQLKGSGYETYQTSVRKVL